MADILNKIANSFMYNGVVAPRKSNGLVPNEYYLKDYRNADNFKPKNTPVRQKFNGYVNFTFNSNVDGINGFRYGDVVKFNGLPARYTQNTVFSVVSISHSVTTQGEWTTSIQCIMRPSLDF